MSEPVAAAHARLWFGFGTFLRDARLGRHWTVEFLAEKAGVSRSNTYLAEAGGAISSESAVRLAHALGLRLDFELTDPRRKQARPNLSADPVHSWMGEFEAAHLRQSGTLVGIDEPYQHYQFAGRADLIAWDLEARALLHIENRTRFPDFQEMAGSYNSKKAYLAQAIAERLGIRRWASQTHVIAALWSSEVLRAVRLRRESFVTICPDSPDAFSAWWSGTRPPAGTTSTLVILDPFATGRQRVFVGLGEALIARPRHQGYAEVAAMLGDAP